MAHQTTMSFKLTLSHEFQTIFYLYISLCLEQHKKSIHFESKEYFTFYCDIQVQNESYKSRHADFKIILVLL